jgi:hypothetical protein
MSSMFHLVLDFHEKWHVTQMKLNALVHHLTTMQGSFAIVVIYMCC